MKIFSFSTVQTFHHNFIISLLQYIFVIFLAIFNETVILGGEISFSLSGCHLLRNSLRNPTFSKFWPTLLIEEKLDDSTETTCY